MTPASAKRFIQKCQNATRELNEALKAIEDDCDKAQFELAKKRVGKVMGLLLVDVMHPVFAEHPESIPVELTGTPASPSSPQRTRRKSS
jgi:hypothetical protein